MAPLSFTAAISALLSVALAGSPVWEGSVRLQEPHPVEHLAIDAAGFAIMADNATAHAIAKRYVSIVPSNENRLWPDRTISYCFATDDAKDRLAAKLVAATQLWQNAGLNRNVFKYKLVTEKTGDACTKHKNRSKILVINYSAEGKLETSLGMIAPYDGVEGPRSMLSDSEHVGMLNAVSNIAHELGHAWGLTHEHQNPHFWTPDIAGGRASMVNGPFDTNVFVCTNLKDYDTMQAKLSAPDGGGLGGSLAMLTLCQSRAAASHAGFSAAEYLPYLENRVKLEITKPNAGDDDVDWASIMLYPTGAGGKGKADPPGNGQALDANDHRAPVLMRRNGQKIPINLVPSARDVEGIRLMYDDPTFPTGNPLLPNDKTHSKFTSFINKFKKDKDCGGPST